MHLILLAKYWQYIVIAVLSLIIVFMTFMLRDASNTMQLMRVNQDLQLANNIAEQSMLREQMERKHYEQNIEAANEYQEREQVIIADAASARDAVASLPNTLSQVTAKAATDADFQRDALAITSDSLETCSTRYSELATTTDRLANSLRATVETNRQ
jgi:hypothetical protein